MPCSPVRVASNEHYYSPNPDIHALCSARQQCQIKSSPENLHKWYMITTLKNSNAMVGPRGAGPPRELPVERYESGTKPW